MLQVYKYTSLCQNRRLNQELDLGYKQKKKKKMENCREIKKRTIGCGGGGEKEAC